MKLVVSIVVHATWDDEANMWVATSDDIDGLAVEAKTIEVLEPKVTAAISDLIELNGIKSASREIPIYITTQQVSHVINPQF